MFRLVRWLISLGILAVVIWFAASVPLGKRTLSGHLRAIFGTQEAKDLAEGTREEAARVAERVRREFAKDGGAAPAPIAPHPRAPLDPIEPHEQKRLDRLIRDKTK